MSHQNVELFERRWLELEKEKTKKLAPPPPSKKKFKYGTRSLKITPATTAGPPPPQPKTTTTPGSPSPQPKTTTTPGSPSPQPKTTTTPGSPSPQPKTTTTPGSPSPSTTPPTTTVSQSPSPFDTQQNDPSAGSPPPPPPPPPSSTAAPPPPPPPPTAAPPPPPPPPSFTAAPPPPPPPPTAAPPPPPPPVSPNEAPTAKKRDQEPPGRNAMLADITTFSKLLKPAKPLEKPAETGLNAMLAEITNKKKLKPSNERILPPLEKPAEIGKDAMLSEIIKPTIKLKPASDLREEEKKELLEAEDKIQESNDKFKEYVCEKRKNNNDLVSQFVSSFIAKRKKIIEPLQEKTEEKFKTLKLPIDCEGGGGVASPADMINAGIKNMSGNKMGEEDDKFDPNEYKEMDDKKKFNLFSVFKDVEGDDEKKQFICPREDTKAAELFIDDYLKKHPNDKDAIKIQKDIKAKPETYCEWSDSEDDS